MTYIYLENYLKLKEIALKFPETDPKLNWVIQIKKIFLEKININILDFLNNIKSQGYRNFLVEKLKRYYIFEDLRIGITQDHCFL